LFCKEKGKGTGLGLKMVYAIVQNYDEPIECSSDPGAGTTFTLFVSHPLGVSIPYQIWQIQIFVGKQLRR
jgi:nitrogen-specific signal transduction histidine kinase